MIYKYEVLNPVTNHKKPFLDKRGFFIVPRIGKLYRYYIECARNDNYGRNYYILLSDSKFDDNCRRCNVDDFGRLKFIPHGELKDYIEQEIKYRANINFEYIESENNYDIFKIE